MKSVNRALEDKYWQLLSAALAVPVFINYSGAGEAGDAYVDITLPANTDGSTLHQNRTDTSVQVAIYSREYVANTGTDIDTIADQVFAVILPTPYEQIDLMPSFQVVRTSLQQDSTPPAFQTDTETYINRTIIFRHYINHNA